MAFGILKKGGILKYVLIGMDPDVTYECIQACALGGTGDMPTADTVETGDDPSSVGSGEYQSEQGSVPLFRNRDPLLEKCH